VLPESLSSVALETSGPKFMVARAMTFLVKGSILVIDVGEPART
jgi:hypothetical protein